MNRGELLAFIEKTSAEVAKMPAWKRGLLEASMKPMNDEPRKPITTKERAMKIEGIPEGYELVRIEHLSYSDQYLGAFGDILIWDNKVQSTSCSHVILRKIKRPKQYRPFANAEEFKPHRDRWVINASDPPIAYRTKAYSDERVWVDTVYTWEEAFRYFNFADDGTPFGVEDESSGPPITRPAQTY